MNATQTDSERLATLIMHLAERSRVVWVCEEGSSETFGTCSTAIGERTIQLRWDEDALIAEIFLEDGSTFITQEFFADSEAWPNARTIIMRTLARPERSPRTGVLPIPSAPAQGLPHLAAPPEPQPEANNLAPAAKSDDDIRIEPAPLMAEPEDPDLLMPRETAPRLVIGDPPTDAPRGPQRSRRTKKTQGPRSSRKPRPEGTNGRLRRSLGAIVAFVLVGLGIVGYSYMPDNLLIPKNTVATVRAPSGTPDPAVTGFRLATTGAIEPGTPHVATRPIHGQNDPHMANSIGRSVPPAPEAVRYVPIDDHPDDGTGGGFTYTGNWDHIENIADGRSNNSSSRSYHPGDSASLTFTGKHLRIYAVAGPQGGYATLRIDGEVRSLLNFYAPTKAPHKLIYTSPALAVGQHVATITVNPPEAREPKRRFINLDGAEYAGT
jgi:hypothetical protein